ncbi:MAG: hypothetical protein QOK24_1568 [Verrucomicrobiota bacterium]|jgi:hypothetical protein
MPIMTARISLKHILIVAAAFIGGAIIGRGFLASKSEPSPKRPELADTRSTVSATSITEAPRDVNPSSQQLSSTSLAASRKSLDAILADRDARHRMSNLEAFINALGPAEYADALKRIRRIPGNNDRELASRLLISRWVQSDPDAALQFAASNRGFEYIADDVFQQAAATDAQAALERAKSLPNADLRYMALRGVLGFMANTDPAGALRLAATLGENRGNEPLTSVIYRQWAANDPQAAALQAAQDKTAEGWRSPVNAVVRTWAGQDPAAAANWSLSLTEPDARSRSVSQVIRQWTHDDATAAANWINALAPGEGHDTAVSAMASAMAATDPQNAVSWARNIPDEGARNRLLQRISREVMWRDPANGTAILQAAGVPPNLIPPPPRRGAPPGS